MSTTIVGHRGRAGQSEERGFDKVLPGDHAPARAHPILCTTVAQLF